VLDGSGRGGNLGAGTVESNGDLQAGIFLAETIVTRIPSFAIVLWDFAFRRWQQAAKV